MCSVWILVDCGNPSNIDAPYSSLAIHFGLTLLVGIEAALGFCLSGCLWVAFEADFVLWFSATLDLLFSISVNMKILSGNVRVLVGVIIIRI